MYLYGARWDSNEEGPVEVNPESHGSDEVVQHLGIVRYDGQWYTILFLVDYSW